MSDSYIALVEKSIYERVQQYQELLRLRAENERLREAVKAGVMFVGASDDAMEELRAENEKLREALNRINGRATNICMLADAGYGISVEKVMPIYETARAALEGVTEPATGDSNA